VDLQPQILHNSQKYIAEKLGGKEGDKPMYFVFHGGSGSSSEVYNFFFSWMSHVMIKSNAIFVFVVKRAA